MKRDPRLPSRKRLAAMDASYTEHLEIERARAAVVNAAMAWFVSITKNEVANVERRFVILDACAALAKLEVKP